MYRLSFIKINILIKKILNKYSYTKQKHCNFDHEIKNNTIVIVRIIIYNTN